MRGTGNPLPENPPEGLVIWGGLSDDAGQVRGRQRIRILALALTGAAHVVLLAALFWPHPAPKPAPPAEAPIIVSLLPAPPVPPAPAKNDPGGSTNFAAPAQVIRPVVTIARTPVSDTSDLLSDSQLAGAASAGEGGGGGAGCDTARAVQQALRRDPLVRAAVEDANRLGKAIMLWDGDWVRTGGQDGKGLSAVREAIVWQVAFASEACRNERMHGLVLLSLADGNTRFAIGSGEWRWSDLLGVH